jgi:succinoglycan biosynthesis transport protein ExoP
MNSEAHEAPDLRDYLRLIWRRGWIMVACLILIPIGIYAYTNSKPKVFESSTVMQVQPGVDDSDLTSPNFAPSQTNLDLVAALVSTSAVSNEAARQLGLPPGALSGAASATADPDTGFVTITADAATAERSRQVATAFADALTSTRRDDSLNRINGAIQTVQQGLDQTPKSDVTTRTSLRTQLQRLQTLKKAQSQNASVVEPARAGAQVAPHPKRNATVGIVLAILIGIALIATAERLDRKIHKPEDLERISGLPFLATIPQEAFPGKEETNDVHESFQTLRASLTYFNADQQLKSLLVVSALQGEGKTTVATNLATAYAASGKRVILVDADLRKPDAAQRMDLDQRAGVSQVLAGTLRLEDAFEEVAQYGHGLRVLPAGAVPPNPSALLGSLRMQALIGELEEMADIVIIDSTPLLNVADAYPLLDKASGIVALIRLDKTPRDAVRRMLRIIDQAGGNLLGLVATDGKRRISGGYGYGYGYGYGDERKQQSQDEPQGQPQGQPQAQHEPRIDGDGQPQTPIADPR